MLVDGGRCPAHRVVYERKPQSSRKYNLRVWRDVIRPRKLRANPVCEKCSTPERPVVATEVDHMDGDNTNDATRNLRSLCKRCHSRKTATQDGGFGNVFAGKV